MKKVLLFAAIAAIFFGSCAKTSYQFATSDQVDLGKTVLVTPNVASLNVVTNTVTAELSGDKLIGLNLDMAKKTVGALALKQAKADVLVAPRFETIYTDGKLSKIIVIGYPATYKAFRPMRNNEPIFALSVISTEDNTNKAPISKIVNNKLIADLEISKKETLTLSATECSGLNEKKILEIAKQKMLRNTNADELVEPQYELINENGIIKSFTLTAYIATYKNYRSVTKEEYKVASATPRLVFNTVADLKVISGKIKAACGSAEIVNLSVAQMKDKVRIKALKEHKADVILNESFYFSYAADGKTITAVEISGTPANYVNFHEYTTNDVIEDSAEVASEATTATQSPFGFILNLFKK